MYVVGTAPLNRGRILFFIAKMGPMYLKSLELNGFKSFAKKIHFDFTTPITAIVGPNGSGKSNVAESFRFVLGEQSMKSLRGKRTEDLIWNGSSHVAKAYRAHVALTFDNRTKLFPHIDFENITLERVVERNTVSEYRLNGSTVRLKDIIEMLSSAHIGMSGHHIISQGEADRVLSVNARERKEMIEDALGLKMYHYKKDESVRKLEKTAENIKEVESIRREIQPHLTFLGKQMERVKRAREMRAELLVRYVEYCARESAYLSHGTETLRRELVPLKEHSKRLDVERARYEKVLAGHDTKKSHTAELADCERQLRAARDERTHLDRELGRFEGMIAAEERVATRTGGTHAAVISAGEVLSFAESVVSELHEAEKNPPVAHALISALRERLTGFIARVRTVIKDARGAEAKQEIAPLRNARDATEKKMKHAQETEAKLADEYDALRMRIEREGNEGREAERTLFRLTTEQNEVEVAIARLAGREETLRIEGEELARDISEGRILAGVEVSSYASFTLPSDALTEERSEQAERKRAIERLKIRLEDAGGSGEDITKEFEEAKTRDAFLEREINDLHATAASLTKLIAELELTLAEQFSTGLQKINAEFQTFFALMFGGGDAVLTLIREKRIRRRDTDIEALMEVGMQEQEGDEETWEGIEIHVNLPRKRIRSLEMLSGGERALTSIALIFAMSQVNPPPFLILDETDAALDEANSRRYGDMIESLSKKSQLILITHNRETMSRAGMLYGVTMGSDGVSQVLSVNFEEAARVAK